MLPSLFHLHLRPPCILNENLNLLKKKGDDGGDDDEVEEDYLVRVQEVAQGGGTHSRLLGDVGALEKGDDGGDDDEVEEDYLVRVQEGP